MRRLPFGRQQQRAGGAILVAALATAAGFLAFVPTAFSGVAELGLIAGFGMLIAFLCTVTFLPAAITLCRPAGEQAEIGFAWGGRIDALVTRWHGVILLVFAALVVLALGLAPRLQFDADPLDTQSPNTEAMRTLRDLMNDPLTNPYSIDILAPNADQARALAARLKQLPTVSSVLTVDSFVPQDQAQKLALVQDAADILGPTLLAPDAAPPVTPAQIRAAARSALNAIDPALASLPADHPLAAIAGDLRQLAIASDQTLLATNNALTRFLPGQLDRLRDRTRRAAGQSILNTTGHRSRLAASRRAGHACRCCHSLRPAPVRGCTTSSNRSVAWHPMRAELR